MDVKIKENIGIRKTDISKEIMSLLKKKYTKANPEFYAAKAMGFYTGAINSKFYLWSEDKEYFYIPRGALSDLNKIFNTDIKVINNTLNRPLGFKIELNNNASKLWPIQEDCLSAVIQNEYQGINNCLLQGVCGSGKTEILLSIIGHYSEKSLVIVDKLDLMRQWIKRAEGRFRNLRVGVMGGGQDRDGNIIIGTPKTLINRINKLKNDFGVIVCDEVHHYAAPMFRNLISKFSAHVIVGATATPKRKDRKEFLVSAAFGKIVFKITDQDLIPIGKAFSVEVRIIPTDFKCNDWIIFEVDRLTNEKKPKFYNFNGMMDKLTKDEERNLLITKYIKREIEQKNKCLVIADRIEHCLHFWHLLNMNGIKTGLMIGTEGYENEREKAPKNLVNGNISCIVASPIVREGFDLPELNRGFIINPSAANASKIEQQVGRMKRMAEGKVDARVYYFWDQHLYNFDKHIKTIRKIFTNVKFVRS